MNEHQLPWAGEHPAAYTALRDAVSRARVCGDVTWLVNQAGEKLAAIVPPERVMSDPEAPPP